jgi:protein ImuA
MGAADTIAALRRLVPQAPAWPGSAGAVELGASAVDAALGGGLRTGALHEIYAAQPQDAGAAAGFALGLAACVMRARPGLLLWIRQGMAEREFGAPYAPGLAEAGIDPRRLVAVSARRMDELLDAALQGARALGGGVVLLEPWGPAKELDLTAARRLALAAEQSGATLTALFAGRAAPCPSPALSRWRVAAAPATAGPRGLMGRPRVRAELIRSRTGRTGAWVVEWDGDACAFGSGQEISRDQAAVSADRPAAADDGAGWRRAG